MKSLVIDERYLNLVNQIVYNSDTQRYGFINGIEVEPAEGGNYYISYKVQYTTLYDSEDIEIDDFRNGKVKFAIIEQTDRSEEEEVEYNRKRIEGIKKTFEEEYRDNMLIYTTHDDYIEALSEAENEDIIDAANAFPACTDLSIHAIYDDFHARRLYREHTNGKMDKEQFFYALINHMSREIKKYRDDNLDYFNKYVLGEDDG